LKGLSGTNTLAYYKKLQITVVKCFKILAPSLLLTLAKLSGVLIRAAKSFMVQPQVKKARVAVPGKSLVQSNICE
jgi:hypothetical protein